MEFKIYATQGASTALYNTGIPAEAVFCIAYSRPNVLDLLNTGKIQWIITTAESGEEAVVDELQMRSLAVVQEIPMTTTFPA